jgi:hypothetical protein
MNVPVEITELQKAARATADKDAALEAKACALMKQYGFFLPGPAKDFFRELADFLNWTKLKGIL